jgi:hypothetical protein
VFANVRAFALADTFKVVNCPVLAVVPPSAAGAAHVYPLKYVELFAEIVAIYAELTYTPVAFDTMPVLARTDTVPEVVIVPPAKPLPAVIEVTVPDPVVGVDQ